MEKREQLVQENQIVSPTHTHIFKFYRGEKKNPQHYELKQTEKKIYVNLEVLPMVLYRLPNDKCLKKITRIFNYTRETSLLNVFSQTGKMSPGLSLGLESGQATRQRRKGLCSLEGTVTAICDIVI